MQWSFSGSSSPPLKQDYQLTDLEASSFIPQGLFLDESISSPVTKGLFIFIYFLL